MYKGYYFIIKIAFVKPKYKFFKSKKRTSYYWFVFFYIVLLPIHLKL